MLKTQFPGSQPHKFWLSVSGWGPCSGSSHQLTGDASTADRRIRLWVTTPLYPFLPTLQTHLALKFPRYNALLFRAFVFFERADPWPEVFGSPLSYLANSKLSGSKEIFSGKLPPSPSPQWVSCCPCLLRTIHFPVLESLRPLPVSSTRRSESPWQYLTYKSCFIDTCWLSEWFWVRKFGVRQQCWFIPDREKLGLEKGKRWESVKP